MTNQSYIKWYRGMFSSLEDRIVDINDDAKQTKNLKELGQFKRPLGQHPSSKFTSQQPKKEKDREMGWEHTGRQNSLKISLTWERKQSSKFMKHSMLWRINPKRVHFKTHCSKMTKIKNKERLLNEAWKKQWIIYKGTPIRLSKDFTDETLRPEERGHI